MASLLRPEYILLRLKQGDLPLEGYTIMFQLVAHTTSYPDDALCAFYNASLNTSCRAPSSEDGPRADFAAFVEWTLARNKPSFPACSLESLASATPDPEPSQPPPRHAEHEPEPTADGSHATSATQEPSPIGATERAIATELEEFASDQVREPATEPATVDVPDGREGAEDSTAHCTTAEGEQRLDLGQIFLEQNLTNVFEDIYEDMPALLPLSKLPDCLDFPPTLPLSIVSAASVPPPLSPGSPSAHPQPTICAVGSPQVCQSPSVSWLEDPSSSPPASESWTPPRPSDPAAPPRLSAPSSPPSPVGPPAPPGSIVPPAPPWSVVAPPSPLDSTPPAAPRRSVPPALWTSSLPQAQPRSSVAPAPPRTSGPKPPPKTLYILLSLFVGARTRLPGGGGNVTPLDFLVGFSHHLPCSSVYFGFSLIVNTCVCNQSVCVYIACVSPLALLDDDVTTLCSCVFCVPRGFIKYLRLFTLLFVCFV
ncbi:Accumulation-associated protein [Labeo rohita]|uniref:Accumulation-associated protein n=1 Tax=Labeo rohita TaxID=84645 RepID=A0ABQ8L280_LABRO|nr:Accumulation-associated protein [Labeo rohita]